MPLLVYILGFTIFSLTTSEFIVAAIMPSLSEAFGEPIGRIGYLIALYALGMVIGGPLMTLALLKMRLQSKQSLIGLLAVYALLQAAVATTSSFAIMAFARLASGVVGAACLGLALALSADLVSINSRGRAAAIVIGGLMLAAVLGLPVTAWIEHQLGWRASFWFVLGLTTLCMVLVAILAPVSRPSESIRLDSELSVFKNRHLWAAYASSALIISAIFAPFSYFTPILTELSGFSESSIPWLLAMYGVASLLGNAMVGRIADTHSIRVMVWGMPVLSLSLAMFAVFADSKPISFSMLIVIGLVGMSMNPAILTRVMNTAHSGQLVNTVHTSIINFALAAGAWMGGAGIAGFGLRAPLWLGVALSMLALVSLLPYLRQEQCLTR